MIVAEILDRFEPGAIGWTVMGVVAALGIVVLVLTALNQAKKFFGRQPTFDEIIKTLLSVDDFDIFKEEQRLRAVGLEKQISDARHSFDERANSDLKRNLETFEHMGKRNDDRDKAVAELRDSVSTLHERTATHVRSLDALFNKCDKLLERMPRFGRSDPRNSDE